MSPEDVVEEAIRNNCQFIVYTYTEPTVFYEYMLDTARLAKKRGLKNGMHTCGYINPEPLEELLKVMDAVNVDLKGFDKEFYSKMGMMAELEPVLNTIKYIKEAGVWLEITNLLIPSKNDAPDKIRQMCIWLKENVGPDVPIHFSRFRPAFKLRNLPPTPIEKLEEAARIAGEAGCKYVYVGNMPGHVRENTYCPSCRELLVARIGFRVRENSIVDGECPSCGNKIAGLWEID